MNRPGPAHTVQPAGAAPAQMPLPAGSNTSLARRRVIALAVFLPCLSLLLVSHWLHPDPAGMGTHTQLGLAPCGFQVATGYPCATCGMTTSFALAAHGRLLSSLSNQPAGMMLSLLTAMLTLISGWSLWSGMPLQPIGRAFWRPATLVSVIAAILLSWVFMAAKVAASA